MNGPAPCEPGERLDFAAMQALIDVHGRAKCVLAMDATMATMTGGVAWEFLPLKLHFRDQAAVPEWHRRVLPGIKPTIASSRLRTSAYGERHLVNEYAWSCHKPDGSLHESLLIAIFHFRDGLISGESLFCDDPWTDRYAEAMDLSVPGVTIG